MRTTLLIILPLLPIAAFAQNGSAPAQNTNAATQNGNAAAQKPRSDPSERHPPMQPSSVRLKDILNVQGVRDNQLVGYGLVVGLDGTGDSQQTQFTVQSVTNMLTRFGVTVPANRVRVKNVAAVMVTATLPPFAKSGDKIDVTVSSIGDAASLQGGVLLQAPLQGADSEVYAVAQGALSIGGFNFGQAGTSVQRNHVSVGRIPNGALVEREVPMPFVESDTLTLSLKRGDFNTATRVVEAINARLGDNAAEAVDAATVRVRVPRAYRGRSVKLLADIGDVHVMPDAVAKVVINERTGTVVLGGNVRLSPVAVAHGNLSVEIQTEPVIAQPLPFAGGRTVVVPRAGVRAEEEAPRLIEVNGGPTISDLVKALNRLGVTPRDLIAILQALKESGALQAELEIM